MTEDLYIFCDECGEDLYEGSLTNLTLPGEKVCSKCQIMTYIAQCPQCREVFFGFEKTTYCEDCKDVPRKLPYDKRTPSLDEGGFPPKIFCDRCAARIPNFKLIAAQLSPERKVFRCNDCGQYYKVYFLAQLLGYLTVGLFCFGVTFALHKLAPQAKAWVMLPGFLIGGILYYPIVPWLAYFKKARKNDDY